MRPNIGRALALGLQAAFAGVAFWFIMQCYLMLSAIHGDVQDLRSSQLHDVQTRVEAMQ